MYCSMHTVFGRVVDGQKYVTEIENQRVDTNHRPYADIRIVRCGELVLIKPSKGEKSVCIYCTAENFEHGNQLRI